MIRNAVARSARLVGDVAAGAAVVGRSGFVRPVLPRPALLMFGVRTLLGRPTVASAVSLQAAIQPSAVAIVDARGSMSWRKLDERANRLANALRERVPRGSRVAFALRNGREAVECYAGTATAGMSAVPINTLAGAAELEHVMATQDPAVVISSTEHVDAIRAARPSATIWLTGEGGGYEEALASASPRPPLVGGSGHVVTHTSGTTGKPKGAERELSSGSVETFVSFLEKVPLRTDDRFLLAPPLFHTFAQGMMAAGLVLGVTLVLPDRFEPEDVLGTVFEHEVTAIALVPVMLRRLLEVRDPPATPSLRIALLSGSALPAPLRLRAEELFGPIFHDLYGSTEVGWATIATPADHAERPGSVGRPGRGMRVFAADEEGRILPPGEVGRIFAVTGFEFSGYTGVANDRETLDGAMEFGDLGYVDGDGYLYVTGRADDMIVTGGENVYPGEVEAVLDEHPLIMEASVVGVDDEEYGQVLHAYIVPRDGASLQPEEVIAFAGERLARYKVPKRVEIRSSLPRTATGKVVKADLLG